MCEPKDILLEKGSQTRTHSLLFGAPRPLRNRFFPKLLKINYFAMLAVLLNYTCGSEGPLPGTARDGSLEWK